MESEDLAAGMRALAERLLQAASGPGAAEMCLEVAYELLRLTGTGMSLRVKRQQMNPFRHLIPLMTEENSLLCSGVPPEAALPLKTMSFTVQTAGGLETVNVDEVATKTAQRYPQFARVEVMEILRRHAEAVLQPACDDWSIAMSAGSMSALDHAIAMFLNPGDTILMEEYTFLAMIDAAMAAGLRIVPVPCDEHGMQPEHLAKLLPVAKVLYTVPVGQNPLGHRMSSERYDAVYELCAAHNVTIVEDDAYFYLQHNSHDSKADDDVTSVAGLDLGKTFASIDRQGLVFRLDTVSKMLTPGFRLGWVTGPKRFIQAYDDVCYISSQSGCSISMVCLGKLLAHWKTEGLEAQVKKAQLGLRCRCRSLLRACQEHLQGLATWSQPQAGMFLWVRMLRPRSFTLEELLASMSRHHVVPMPGGFCSPVRGDPVPFFRLSYITPPESYDLAIRRLQQVLIDLSVPADGYRA